MQQRPTVSFIGLGQMGQPMARHLLQGLQGKRDLFVFDAQAERMTALTALGAHGGTCLDDVVPRGGVVFAMLPDDRSLMQVALTDGGILAHLGTGGTLIVCSSVSPDVSAQLARLSHQQHCAYLAAPALGGPEAAARGDLSFVLAGPRLAKRQVMPLFACMGQRLYDLGERVEAANVMGLAWHLLRASLIEALGEAAALIDAYHLNRSRLADLLQAPSLWQQTADAVRRIGARDFSEPQLSVQAGLRMLDLALHLGQQRDLDLPYADVAYGHLLAALDAGREQEDWSVLSDFARQGATDWFTREEDADAPLA